MILTIELDDLDEYDRTLLAKYLDGRASVNRQAGFPDMARTFEEASEIVRKTVEFPYKRQMRRKYVSHKYKTHETGASASENLTNSLMGKIMFRMLK